MLSAACQYLVLGGSLVGRVGELSSVISFSGDLSGMNPRWAWLRICLGRWFVFFPRWMVRVLTAFLMGFDVV